MRPQITWNMAAGSERYNFSFSPFRILMMAVLDMSTKVVATFPFWMTAIGIYALLRSGFAWRLAIDEPNQRSLHVRPTPRVGGIVLVPAFLAMWLAASLIGTQMVLLVAGLCVMSYFDDRAGMPVALRLIGHLAVAILFVLFVLGIRDFFWCVTWGLAIVWLTNLYNFMDGLDGLAGGMALSGFFSYGWVAAFSDMEFSYACWSVAAAAAGFLVFNFPPAKVFMGDAGSIPLGFLAAGLGLLGWRQGLWPLWFPLLVFSPFVVDASVTLLLRLVRGERVWQAHREHYYQRLIRMGWSHRRTALAEYALMAATAGSALAALGTKPARQTLILALWCGIYLGLMATVDRRWRRFVQTPGAGDRG